MMIAPRAKLRDRRVYGTGALTAADGPAEFASVTEIEAMSETFSVMANVIVSENCEA